MPLFEIDPDITRAKTLRSEFYTSEDLFELSKEKIFARTWQFAGREEDLGQMHPQNILPPLLEEPVLFVRSASGLRCMSNVCTHRGMLLVEEPCKANLIRCRYHGRRFSLEGKFLSMPEFDGVEDFPSQCDDLTQVPCGTKGGFVFASLVPAVGLDDFLGESATLICDFDSGGLRFADTRTYAVHAHWALYCENYLEGFHIPYVHQGLNEVVDYGTYTTETFRYSSLQTGRGANGEVEARYLFVFPNLMFNYYPWGISVNVVRPISPSVTEVDFLTYIRNESLVDSGAGGDLHTVELEDERVVECVQRGVRSRFYAQGRYSPTREQGTHHFHRLIAEFME